MEIIKFGQQENIQLPLSPSDVLTDGLPKVFIKSSAITVSGNDLIGLNITKNKVPCKVFFTSRGSNIYDDGYIAYQGNTSLSVAAIVKKGFTIDFDNNHRFKNWLDFDSFHLKGYYSDWTHSRDLVSNKLLEAMYKERDAEYRRPYMSYNNFGNAWYAKTDVSALCHIDGFPVELYINDVYWGLYSLNIKKSRGNYLLSKNDVQHIQVEAANDMTYTTSGLDWSKLEIRNPKSDSGNTSFEEGVEPNAGEVKTAWVSFITFLTSITSNTTKASIEQHLNMTEFIDTILFCDFVCDIDFWCKNTLYTTWDGAHWSPLIYDLDISFGIDTIYGDDTLPYNYNASTFKANTRCPWLPILKTIYAQEIEDRYKELREKGIFSLKFVEDLFESFTKEVGYDAYKRDVTRWPDYPSLGHTANNFYESVSRISTFVRQRIGYLDTVYNYTTT